jgi:hypothetical protein
MTANKGAKLEEFADKHAQAAFVENQDIARKARALRAELDAERVRRGAAEAEAQASQRELAAYERDYSQRPEWLRAPKTTKENRGTLLAMMSDFHIGEVVSPSEMDGGNAYNLKIAEARLERFFRRTTFIARNYLAGVHYDGIVLALNGDMVSGDIHDELAQTNECSTYEAVLWAVPKLAAGIEMFLKEFQHVHVVSTPGNHGRDSQRPRYKRRSGHNADTLISRLVARQFDGAKGVTFDIPDSYDVGFKVYGSRFTMEHGDELKFSGTSEIGALGPVKRGTMRKQTQLTAEGKPFDYNLVSHFHQYVPAASQGFVMNGTGKGPDEYSRGRHFKPEPAQQALMVVTPEYGITAQMPVFVVDRKAEGW